MVRKYLLAAAVFLMILFSTSTTTASLLSLRERMYERFQENSAFRLLFGRISQFVFYKDDEATDSDGPEGDVRLPNIIDVDGEVTPDDGNETVVSKDDSEDTPTIDINGEEGTTLINGSTVNENKATNDTTVEKDGEKGRTLERVIEIITGYNGKLGAMLERVVERTFAPGTTQSDVVAENIVDKVVVVGGSGGTADNNKAELVVLTDGGQ